MSLYFSKLLNTLIDWTDEEISNGKKFLDWDEVAIHWEDVDLHWEDVFILLDRKRGGSGASPQRKELELREYVEGNPWKKLRDEYGEEGTEKIIKVLCKINNIEYSSILENRENIRVIVNDFVRKPEEVKIKIKF